MAVRKGASTLIAGLTLVTTGAAVQKRNPAVGPPQDVHPHEGRWYSNARQKQSRKGAVEEGVPGLHAEASKRLWTSEEPSSLTREGMDYVEKPMLPISASAHAGLDGRIASRSQLPHETAALRPTSFDASDIAGTSLRPRPNGADGRRRRSSEAASNDRDHEIENESESIEQARSGFNVATDVPGARQDGRGSSALSTRRRLGTTTSDGSGTSDGDTDDTSDASDTDDVSYQVDVVATVGGTSTDWSSAVYRLVTGNPVPGQTDPANTVQGRGSVYEGDEVPVHATVDIERGCYVLYTTAGTRPYDVVWQVEVDGEIHQNAEGGGKDRHTFGIGGALCGMSSCYTKCYEDQEDMSTDDCSSFGDLLAPPDEPVGANCSCTSEEELELRLMCLYRGYCDERSQCYLVDDAAEEITTASTMKIVSYISVSSDVYENLNNTALEVAVGQWLDFDPVYVELTLVNGIAPTVTSSTSSNRRLHEETLEDSEAMLAGMEAARPSPGLRTRRTQNTTTLFKRVEFLIIGGKKDGVELKSEFEDASSTIEEGVRGLNTVFAAQDESTGLTSARAHTAEYKIQSERVAAADVPTASIAGTGVGAGVDSEGQIVEATEAPIDDDDGNFTRETQFLVGAGLVVVVSFVLSIVACIVCHMKRKERKAFAKQNQPVDGRPKPIQYVDPWGSVARTFQNDDIKRNGSSASKTSGNAQRNGTKTANGSSSTA